MTIYHERAERAANFVAGALNPSECADWESALADPASPESAATAELEGALLALTASIPAVEPPAGIKAALLAAVVPPQGFVFRFTDDAGFRPTPIPGVSFRLLHRDKGRNVVSCLLKLAPGAHLPTHSHRGVEECLVLEGTIFVGQTRMGAGDYQRAEPDSEHVEQWTETGALVYLSAPDDLFLQG